MRLRLFGTSFLTFALFASGISSAQAIPSPDNVPGVPVADRSVVLTQPYWTYPSDDPERNLDPSVDDTRDLELNGDGDIDDNGEMNNSDGDNDGICDPDNYMFDQCNLFYGPKKKYVSFSFDGGQTALATQASILYSQLNSQSKLCEGWDDLACKDYSPEQDDASMWGFVNLPPCTELIFEACIEGMRVGSGENFTSGSFDRLVDNSVSSDMRIEADRTENGNNWNITKFQYDETESRDATRWDENSDLGLPAGSSPSLWTVPGQTNAGGSQTYMARASLQIDISNGQVTFNEFSAEIVPYVEVEANDGDRYGGPLVFEPPIWYERDTDSSANTRLGMHHRPMLHQSASFSESAHVFTDPLVCAWEEVGKCGAAVRFSNGTVGELTVRIPKSLGGWFHGRLTDADLSMTSYSADLNRLVVSGKAVDVPMTSAFFPLFAQNGAATTDYQQYWQDQIATWDDGDDRDDTSLLESYELAEGVDRGGIATASWWAPNDVGSLDDFIRYSPTMDEEAKGMNNAWRFATLPAQGTDHECFADKSRIQGIITTNAMVYQAGLPLYTDGKFRYQVAGVHKNYDGSVFKGNYDLVMRADDARCLYGLPLVVPDAKVTVRDSQGNPKSFNSSVELEGEWLKIQASDFTFSEPAIEVEFREYVAPVVVDTQTSAGPTTQIANTNKSKSVKISAKKQLMVKSALSANSLRYLAKVKAKPGDKIYISLQTGKKKNVDLRNSYIYFKKPGTYVVKVKVDRKVGPTVTKYIRVNVKK